MTSSRFTALRFLPLLGAAWLGGCQLAALFGGHGIQQALYQFPKNNSVLVLVDVRPELSVPPTFATNLGDRITSHLYRNKATDHVVPQSKLVNLQLDSAKYSSMGIADIAQATGADLVVEVYVVAMNVMTTNDGTVNQGYAQAQVKVINRNGERLWPGDLKGQTVTAQVTADFTSTHNHAQVLRELTDQLVLHTGRMFHSYDLEDEEMIKTSGEMRSPGR